MDIKRGIQVKIKLIIASVILIIMLVAVNVIPKMDFIKKDNNYVDSDDGQNSGGQGNSGTTYRDLYDPDWDTDIFTLDKYLQKKRYIEYGVFNGSYVEISETLNSRADCVAKDGASLALMYDFFYYAQHGQHEELNGLFAEKCTLGKDDSETDIIKEPYEAFPMQKIYDMFVRKYEYENPDYSGNPNVTATYYLVTYKIMENDGLFRYEVDADAELVQLFGILTYNDGSSEIYMMMDLPNFNVYG